MQEKAILYDATLCTACRGCQVACKQWNENEGENTINLGSYENPSDLSPQTWLKMEFREVEREERVNWLFNRRACMHCTDAVCVDVCPSGALYYHELGLVGYNKDICTGCGYCVDFCPFKVPRSERNLVTGVAKMDKCTFCTTPSLDMIAQGWEPACVKSCPTGALKYGDRDELVEEGGERVENLKSDGYSNAYLYGDTEMGGLHVLYVLNDSPDVYGLPVNPEYPVLATVWKDIIQPLGWVAGGLTVLGLGVNYVVARRAKRERDLAKNKGR